MHTTLGTKRHLNKLLGQGIRCAPISETQGKLEVRRPSALGQVSQGPSDLVNLVLQVAEQRVQAFGGTPELLEHEAFLLIHVLKH